MSSSHKCSICLECIGDTDITITKCDHAFCTSCLLTNIHESNKCPICREVLTKPVDKNKPFTEEVQNEIRDVIFDEHITNGDIEDFLEELKTDTTVIQNIQTLYDIVSMTISATLITTEMYLQNGLDMDDYVEIYEPEQNDEPELPNPEIQQMSEPILEHAGSLGWVVEIPDQHQSEQYCDEPNLSGPCITDNTFTREELLDIMN